MRYIDNEDCIHLSKEGIELCAEQVISYIREAVREICDTEGDICDNSTEKDKTAAPVLI